MDNVISEQSVINTIHKTIYSFFDVVENDSGEPMNEKDKLLLRVNKAICNEIKKLPPAGKMRIIIRFKSGYELPITCDEFSMETSRVTGEIDSYDIKGIKDNKPIFFRSEDVECVYAERREE